MIDLHDVETAAARIHGVAHRTPVITSRTLDTRTGARLLLKAEHLQRIGAFKFRGAYNAISALDPDARERGVFAYSSGNHAQAVALSAALLGTAATILMPEDAPALKVAATRGYGAEVVTYDRYTQDRTQLGERLADERGAVLVPPFEDDRVMAGQGTVALELFDDATTAVGGLDILVVQIGGGGLISGCATVADAISPATQVIGVEPEIRSLGRTLLATGARMRVAVPHTIADGQQGEQLGERTAAIIADRVQRVVGVTDEELIATMRTLFERTKQVVEPSGAMALAAVLNGHIDVAGARVGVVLSGGNIGLDRFAELTA